MAHACLTAKMGCILPRCRRAARGEPSGLASDKTRRSDWRKPRTSVSLRPMEAPARPPADVGEIIASYRLEELIGQGGMSWVFSARHMRLDRRAAVKVLYPEMAQDSEYVGRFFSEARLANEVRHPNVIEIFDFISSEEPRRVACIMELLPGVTLERLVKGRPMQLLPALNAAIQLTDALTAVHAAGVVHRDLKPGNVMIIGDPKGDLWERPALKILDFGIAKSVDRDHAVQLTRTGMIIGTPSYMAPEQIAGEKVSPATDLYAFAEILYEMLTGRRLFDGEFVVIFRAKLLGELPDLTLPADLPFSGELTQLLRACLREVAADRPPLTDVRAVLESFRDELISGDEQDTKVGEPARTRLLERDVSTAELPSQLRYAQILSALDDAETPELESDGTEIADVAAALARTDPGPDPRPRLRPPMPLGAIPGTPLPVAASREETEPERLRGRGRSAARVAEVNPRAAVAAPPVIPVAPMHGQPTTAAPTLVPQQRRSETVLATTLFVLSVLLFGVAIALWLRSLG